MRALHGEGAELAKECALEGFCEEICYHVFGGAMSYFDPTLFHLVCDVEVFNVEVARLLAGGSFTVDLETLCCLVVLMEMGGAGVALCCDEEVCSYHPVDNVADAQEFSLSGAVSVIFFPTEVNDGTLT